MSSFSSLSRAISGLMASQTALNTTAHNLSNVNTRGYVRQEVLQVDSSYQTVGTSRTGLNQVGRGTDVASIRQVRDLFLDNAYRNENSRYGFYSALSGAVDEIETVLGETEGQPFSGILRNLWSAINELAKHPDGLETRATVVENAVLFAEAANSISEQLDDYQTNLNEAIIGNVDRINEIGARIDKLNEWIATAEASGGTANDYRDERNTLVDELSGYVNTSTKEDPSGHLNVYIENIRFVSAAGFNEMGTVKLNQNEMVTPYWPYLSDEASSKYYEVIDLDEKINAGSDNDKGHLKGLLRSRGSRQANYTDLLDSTTYNEEVKDSIVMTVQAQFDTLVHGVVTMINDVLAPSSSGPPYGLDGSSGHELFSRKSVDRFDGSGNLIPEDANDLDTLYSANNIEVNKDILENYNRLCLSSEEGLDGDSSVVQNILDQWKVAFAKLDPDQTGKLNINDFYNGMVSDFGNRGNTIYNQVYNQEVAVTQIDNQRSSLMGVSSDEELTNMIKFQHAYNAASKVVSVVDEMIQTIINGTGTVGR